MNLKSRKPFNGDKGYHRSRKLSPPFGGDTHLVLYDRAKMAEDPSGQVIFPGLMGKVWSRWALVLKPSGRWIASPTLAEAEAALNRLYDGRSGLADQPWLAAGTRDQADAQATQPADQPDQPADAPAVPDDIPPPPDGPPFAQARVEWFQRALVVTQRAPSSPLKIRTLKTGGTYELVLGALLIPPDQAQAVADAILAVARASSDIKGE